MNNISVLDGLALDFVNSLLNPNHFHKNTIVCGDIDKFYHWHSLFEPKNIHPSLIKVFPYIQPTCIYNYRNCAETEIKTAVKNYSRNISTFRSAHRYFLVRRDVEVKSKYANRIDFPYGGEYYDLKPLEDIDVLEIIKLLLVHGWHLLNTPKKAHSSKRKPDPIPESEPVSVPDVSQEKSFYDYFENTEGKNKENTDKPIQDRIPLAILEQLYNHFYTSKKTKTTIQTEMQALGYKYCTRDMREIDQNYFQELADTAERYKLKLEICPSDKQKSLSCKLLPEFWDELGEKKLKEIERQRMSEFDLFLIDISEEYAKFFPPISMPEPEPNPFAGFIKPEKFRDEDLQ